MQSEQQYLQNYDPSEFEHPSVTVDILIFTVSDRKLRLLLIRRSGHPYLGKWAIPGGFLQMKESADEAAARRIREEAGVENVHLEQLYTFSAVDRDPRTRVISIAYLATVPCGRLQFSAGVGAGCVAPGSAYNCMGSSSWIALTVKKPIVDEEMRTMNWAHCVPGYLHPSGTMQTAGSSIKWLADNLCAEEAVQAQAEGGSKYALIDRKAAKVPVGANGVMFLPYMLGERTPWWNPDARGVFAGLNLATTRDDLMRAVLEGVALNLGYIVDIFRKKVPFDSGLRLIGGGARSTTFRQILADATGCTICTLKSTADATSMGAAIVGGVACGIFPGFEVTERLLAVDERTEPDERNVAFYKRRLATMVAAYHGLEGVYRQLKGEQNQ